MIFYYIFSFFMFSVVFNIKVLRINEFICVPLYSHNEKDTLKPINNQ